jgi:hypothetical protein
LGQPQAIIQSFDLANCASNGLTVSLDEATGVLTAQDPIINLRGCNGSYTIGNAAGVSSAAIGLFFGPPF